MGTNDQATKPAQETRPVMAGDDGGEAGPATDNCRDRWRGEEELRQRRGPAGQGAVGKDACRGSATRQDLPGRRLPGQDREGLGRQGVGPDLSALNLAQRAGIGVRAA